MKRYNPKEIEPKWQAKWAETKIYEANLASDKPKYIGFGMFNYPSGAGIHIGHAKNFTLPDVILRAKRMQGFEAYSPVGFDSFGLPAENYAIKTGTSPRETTDKAIANFRKQYRAMGWSQDWSKEIDTSQPDYYKWTQWVFLKLFEHGLAYQKDSLQWWCPHDKTVLANEQVENGKCWRCGHVVEKKRLKQWFFRITDYVEQILEATDALDWTESVKTMQKNWIGKSVGSEVKFSVEDAEAKHLAIYTTRVDTLFGATFLVVAPEHELVPKLTSQNQKADVEKYVAEAEKKSDIDRMDDKREKTGVFTGNYAINPINNQKIPIWIADYVLAGYGTGAIMAVPAHDLRDNEFAKKFSLPIIEVVEPVYGEPQGDEKHKKAIIVILRNPKTDQVVVLDWGPRKERSGGKMLIGGGLEDREDIVECAKREIIEETGYTDISLIAQADTLGHGYFYSNVKNQNYSMEAHGLYFELNSEAKQSQNLDDGEKQKFSVTWVPSNLAAAQLDDGIHRYFYERLIKGECYHGEGILINSNGYNGQDTSQARETITAELAKNDSGSEKTNYKVHDWLISRQRYWGAPIPIIHCPEHGAVAVPEDQLPVVLPEVKNFAPTGGATSVLATVEDWVNVPCPTCNKPAKRETDTMDGYACSSWYFLRYLDPHNAKAAWDVEMANKWMPVDFYNGGDHATAHLLYARFSMRFFNKIGLSPTPEPFKKMYYHAKIMAPDGTAFSKSKGNGIDPLEIIESGYGADSLRTYIMFIAPPDMESPWSNEGVPGCYRFLNRIWVVVDEFLSSEKGDLNNEDADFRLRRAINQAIKKVTSDIENVKMNTAVSALMECVNELYKIKAEHGYSDWQWQPTLLALVQLVSPFAPHISEELWEALGQPYSIYNSSWPMWDEKYLAEQSVKLAVQINGKLRGEIQLAIDTDEATALEAAKALTKVAEQLVSKQILKTIYIPSKVINLVIK